MAGTVSVSKGVFAFKRQKERKHKNAQALSTLDYWGGGLEGEEQDQERFRQLTFKNYISCWKIASDILQELQDNIHSKVFQGLVTYTHTAGQRLALAATTTTTTSDQPFGHLPTLAYVPTACLVTGVNMPDRDATFDSLVGLLRASVTPHIARLESKECTTVRAAMYKMISQLIGGSGWADLEDDDEEERVMAATGPKVKRRQCTMGTLAAWYKEQVNPEEEDSANKDSPSKATKGPFPSSPSKRGFPGSSSKKSFPSSPSKRGFPGSPSKRGFPSSPTKPPHSPAKRPLPSSPRKADRGGQESEGSPVKRMRSSVLSGLKRSSRPPLVVILEDLESFQPRVLNDLILICSEYRGTVPVVLVFGVATTPDAVHQNLSQDASACLAMEVFRAEPSTHYLTRVIEKVLMSNKLPFHLGGRPFKLLLDIFLYSDLSVENFIKGLKVCMLEHFMSHSSSFLCCPPAKRALMLRNTTTSQLDAIRRLPSFKTLVEAAPPKEQVLLLLDEAHTKKTITSLLEQLDVWYARFCVLVKVVKALTCRLPGAPLGRQVREVLAVCLSRPLVETEEFEEAVKGIRNMAREELLETLQCVCEVLQEHHREDEVLAELLNEISLLVGRLSSLDQLDQGAEEKETEEAAASGGTGVILAPSDRFRLREKLLEMAKKKPKKGNVYESLRSEVIQFLSNTFTTHLQPPSSQPLHEVLFFHSSMAIKRLLVGLPRPALTTALTNPHHYLQCKCCHLDEPSGLVTTLPDISVAYKLHLECGRLINLYDWLQAFVSVVGREGEDEDGESLASSRMVDEKLQARFVLAVSELQFLGFVKPTKRKTDHVARLTWGGC